MNENKITLPVAIVIAGALIAGAILITRVGVVGGGPASAINADNEPLKIGFELYTKIAKEAGIKEKAFNECLVSEDINKFVDSELDNVIEIGGRGTPYTVVIALDGTRAVISGALPYETVKSTIDKALAGTLEPGPAELSKMRPVDGRDHVIGGTGEVTLVEYSDFQCPFCARFHPTLRKVIASYPQVKWVYRHFPLTNNHAEAKPAAIASECIAKLAGNDAFWKFADTVFAAQ